MKNRKAPEENRRRSHGRKVFIGLTLGTLLFALCPCAHAQQQDRIPRIGWLSVRSASTSGQQTIIRMLRDLGYVEGKNVAFEYRFADDKLGRLPALADELVRLKVDVLLTPGTPGALALKKATRTIPIVFLTSQTRLRPDWLIA
jgi:putative ABC transport system substrate-binding protein